METIIRKVLHQVVFYLKYLDLKGTSVINKRGDRLGRVYDFIFDAKNKRITGLIICNTLVSEKYYCLGLGSLVHYKEFLEIDQEIYKIKKSIISKNKRILLRHYLNMEIKDIKGIGQGKLIDMFINVLEGDLVALVISNGFFEDLLNGRNIINVSKADRFGENNIIIDECKLVCKNDSCFKKYLKE